MTYNYIFAYFLIIKTLTNLYKNKWLLFLAYGGLGGEPFDLGKRKKEDENGRKIRKLYLHIPN